MTVRAQSRASLGFHLESNAFAPVSEERAFPLALLRRGRRHQPRGAARRFRRCRPRSRRSTARWTRSARGHRCRSSSLRASRAGRSTSVSSRPPWPRCATRLIEAGKIDAVYISNHGGMVSTGGPDPDGELYAMVRAAVGTKIPVVATVDLHANISERMVANVDALVSYRTNPHMDQAERAVDAARLLKRFLSGKKSRRAFIRLPLTPASVTLLTREGPVRRRDQVRPDEGRQRRARRVDRRRIRVQRHAEERRGDRRSTARPAPTCAARRSTSPGASGATASVS